MGAQREPPTRTTLWLTGDVMTGRGIDQVLPHACAPRLFEPCVTSAGEYVELAERANGPIPRPVALDYPWGDALAVIERHAPALRLINLETAVTTSDDALPKGINYRMHPANRGLLEAPGIQGAVLANNHVLDWGEAGLRETLATLEASGIRALGAGHDAEEAAAAGRFAVPGGAVRVFALAHPSSGVPVDWAATADRPGVNLLPALTDEVADALADEIARQRSPGDIVVVSLHWGGNWGYAIPDEQRAFAHRLIEKAGVDLVWGHSSHHPRGIEVYRERLILYGCGDLINDYEGIGGHESFRDDLVLLYFPTLELADGRLAGLTLVPLQLRRFRLNRASRDDAAWLARRLDREGRPLGTRVRRDDHDRLVLEWPRGSD